MQSKLYLVATPIGNLKDISFRAIEVLNNVNFIASEDIRVTIKLLNHYNIKRPIVSCHGHNEFEKSNSIVKRILDGEDCALVSDAGTPCISDPGEVVVKLCIEKGVEVTIIPGACASISALCVSGLSTSKFHFEGFLSVNKKNKINSLKNIKDYPYTLIFYEAPHKLLTTLKDMIGVLGDRNVVLVRELTKIYETKYRDKLSAHIKFYEDNKPRGEYVLIVEGCSLDKEEKEFTLEQAILFLEKLILDGSKLPQACKQAADFTGFKKSDLYKNYIDNH